jgi:predicted kinase
MAKIVLNKPILICFYGYPGSGKSYVARNIEEELGVARVSADRLRHELFSKPKYDAQENAIVTHLLDYMSSEFLKAGTSVVYDANAMRIAQRRRLQHLAKKSQAEYLLIWLQVTPDFAFGRTQRRDKRTQDDKYSANETKATFEYQMSLMQNPTPDENYLVISGKHSFQSHKSAIISRLSTLGLITPSTAQTHLAKPGLVNLIPSPRYDEFDPSRRNISVV